MAVIGQEQLLTRRETSLVGAENNLRMQSSEQLHLSQKIHEINLIKSS